METLALNFGHWVTESVFLTHTELLNNWRPKDNFLFDPISDRQEKTTLYVINFVPPYLFYFLIQSRTDRKKTTLYVINFALPYLFYFFYILNLTREVRGHHQTSRAWKTGTIHLRNFLFYIITLLNNASYHAMLIVQFNYRKFIEKEKKLRSINSQKKNEANTQPSWLYKLG